MSDRITSDDLIYRPWKVNQYLDYWWDVNKDAVSTRARHEVEKEIRTYLSRVSTYQFDLKNPFINNADQEQIDWLKEWMFFSKQTKKNLIGSRIKTTIGKSATLLRVGGNKIVSDVMEVMGTPKTVSDEPIEVYMTKNSIQTNEQQEQMLSYYRLFFNKQGKPQLDRLSAPIDDNFTKAVSELDGKVVDSYVYEGIDFLPVEIDINNEESRPDWWYAKTYIGFESRFDTVIVQEWEYVKTQMLNNLVYNPDKSAEEVQADIENGKKRVHEVADPDGKLQSALTYLSSGGITTDIARGIKEHFKNEVREMTMTISQLAGGNNKHTTEVVGANVHPLNYMWTRKQLTEEFFARLYHKLMVMSNIYGFAQLGELPTYLDLSIPLARPLELMLQMNSDGSEQDPNTRVNENINTNIDETSGGE